MIEPRNLSPFKHFCVSIGNIPTSYLESMSYYEMLNWLCNYLEKTVIPAIDNNAEALSELQGLFNQLKTYVDNYFKNLNIQEEINNKLDDMAESGELTDIIAQYLQLAGILAFNSVSELEEAENLSNGSFVRTYGKDDYLDGKGRYYKIRTVLSSDVIDGFNKVALTNYPTLLAEIIPEDFREEIVKVNNKISENYHSYPTLIGSDIQSRIYIDGVNGDDNNIGSSDYPIKTIDKFFNLLNEGKTDIRCNIVTSGVYEASHNIISQCTIHIKALVPGVEIKFLNTEDIASCFYNCHLNFEGYDSNNPIIFKNEYNNQSIYCDNCLSSFVSVKFDNCSNFSMNGGCINASGLYVPQLYLNGCNYDVYNLTLDNSDKNKVIVRYGSNGVIRGVINLPSEKINSKIFVIERSTLTFHPTFNVDTSVTTTNSFTGTYAIIHTTQTYINYLTNIGDVAPSFTQTTVLKGNATFEPGTYQPN